MKTLIYILFLLAFRASATNYYLSVNGNDQYSGTRATDPWRSLKKLSETMAQLKPGDSVLLERGSVFEGELRVSVAGEAGKEIYFGAYGSGANPVVSGSVEIKNWTLFRGNIWVADGQAMEPGNLFMDGRFQPLGRFPNEGFRTFSCTSQCRTSLNDNSLAFPDGYWDHAEVVVRSSRWTLDNLPVSTSVNGTLHFSIPASYPLQTGYGYFIQRHLGTLDKPGEWFFDKSLGKIFFYSSPNDTPAKHVMEVSVTDVGLTILKGNFITVENLSFRHQRMCGVRIKYSSDILLRQCVVEYSGTNGLEVASCQNPTVAHCYIIGSNNNGVEWTDNLNGLFVENTIKKTGLHPGRGESGNATYIGLNVTANNQRSGRNHFQYNTIDSTGYIGIDFRTGQTLIQNNVISNFCAIKDDGGAIYTWGNAYGDNKIDGNIIVHGIGSAEGTPNPDHSYVSGIYIDDRSAAIQIVENTIAYCPSAGILIHNAKQIEVQGNTLFGNGNHLNNRENGQLCIKLDGLVPQKDVDLNLRVSGNSIVATQEGSHCLYLSAEKEQDLRSPGFFDHNQYRAVRPDQVVGRYFGQGDACHAAEEFELSAWQNLTNNETGSQFNLVQGSPIDLLGKNLIQNGRMTTSIEGWMIWPSHASIARDRTQGTDGPSLKVQFPSGIDDALLYYAGFSLSRDKLYRLSFTARSVDKTRIEFVPLKAVAPWDAVDEYVCFSTDTVFRQFAYYFMPNQNSKQARLNFKANTTFWIDNVALTEVMPQSAVRGDSLQLIYNSAEKSRPISLSENFEDLDGHPISKSAMLPGYHSIILLKRQ